MKTLRITLLLLSSLQTLLAQSPQNLKQLPTLHFVLSDSSVVSGRVVRQDSNMVVVRKRNGELTYLETYQIARQSTTMPQRTSQPAESITVFKLKDGATVYGRVVRRTPVAVVVRQQNGTQTYIDPGDIISTGTTSVAGPPLPITQTSNASVGNVPEGGLPYLLNNRPAFTPGAGQVYYRNAYLLRNELETGITNGWSVGVVFNPLLINLFKTSEYLNDAIYTNADFGTQLYTRIGIPIGGKVRFGLGLLTQLQHPDYSSTTTTTFMGQAMATFGDRRSNVTVGYTFRLGSDYSFLLTEGAVAIGTMQALSPSLTFISDNTIKIKATFGPLARLSAALRIHSRYHAFDLGVLSAVNQYYSYSYGYSSINLRFPVYPYLGYNVQLGRR
ncbi:hypothetical protein [Fibrella arboris]|uniref:hypothetical protein n=1 Tax=Fibrella arboris TaxID=3242486 RepID=UPI0035219C33